VKVVKCYRIFLNFVLLIISTKSSKVELFPTSQSNPLMRLLVPVPPLIGAVAPVPFANPTHPRKSLRSMLYKTTFSSEAKIVVFFFTF